MPRRTMSLIVVLVAAACATPNSKKEANDGSYRLLPPLCLPCGVERSLGIVSSADFERIFAELGTACGESDEALQWRRKLEASGIDFGREALVILWDWIGTQGTPHLEVAAPKARLLTAEIQWDIPDGPARPVATAACFCFAVDKSMVDEVQVEKGPATVLSLMF